MRNFPPTVFNGRFLTETPTGVQRFCWNIIEALAEARDDFIVVAPQSTSVTCIGRVPVVKVGSHSGVFWEQCDLPRWLLKHGTPLLMNLACRAPLRYRNQVSMLHDLIPMKFPGGFTRRFRSIFRFVARFGVVFGSRMLLTPSEFSKSEISSYYRIKSDNIVVIPGAVDSHLIGAGINISKSSVSASETPFFLAFGRPGVNRNTTVVLEALGQLPSELGLEVRFVGSADPALIAQARTLPHQITFTGRVSDTELSWLYHNAVAFVAPSLYEGFDLPPLEAQTAGVPIIASDIPVHREVLGTGAVYFPPLDPSSLADTLSALVSDKVRRDDMSARGILNSRRFQWIKSAQILSSVIDRMLVANSRATRSGPTSL